MKKLDFLIIGLILFNTIVSVLLSSSLNFVSSDFTLKLDRNRTNSDKQTTKILTLVQLNQQRMEELLLKLDLHLNYAIEEIGSSGSLKVNEIRKLLLAYIEEGREDKASENLRASIMTVETDSLVQEMLDEGLAGYEEENFTEAVKLYKQVLEINPYNSEALCYKSFSLYSQNPGDGSNFPEIKNNLRSLLDGDILTHAEKLSALNVLLSISLEEGNADSINLYQEKLKNTEENSQ